MNYQPNQIEKTNIQSSYTNSNFSQLESYTSEVINKGCTDTFVYTLLAVACSKQKKFSKAEKYFLKIVNKEPHDIDHNYNLAELYRETKNYKNSIYYLKKCLQIDPNNIKALLSFAVVSYHLEEFKNSFDKLDIVLSLSPHNTDAMLQKSLNFMSTGGFQEALGTLIEIGNLTGYYNDLCSDISNCYMYLGKIEEAKKFNILAGNSKNASYNNGLMNLKLGNYKEGWLAYEDGINNTRILQKGFEMFVELPLWGPEKSFNSVVVITEQGIGDEIMFSTLLIDLQERVNDIYLFCDPRLKLIFKKKYKFIKFIQNETDIEHLKIESQIAIGSLAQFFRNSEIDFKKSIKVVKELKRNKTNKKKKPLIGLSWRTQNIKFATERNISLALFSPILKNVNYDFINLQYGDNSLEVQHCEQNLNRKIFLVNDNDNYNNIDGLAANISKCDLVITIDNSTVHLSGLLDKKTFLLLPFVSEWRWQENRSDTPWYESVRIFRQPEKFNWATVIGNVENELSLP